MSERLSKKGMLQKVFQISGFTLISRFLGIIREGLQAQYLGVGAMSDAFITAFKIPNFFRKIFAEGALSASFIPEFVKLVRENKIDEACRFISLAFLFFEGIVLCLTILVLLFTKPLVCLIAPGFSAEQILYTIPYLQILFPFLFFVSSSALLAGALQSMNHFIIPSAASVVLNIAYIGSLWACIHYSWSTEMLCYGIVAGGALTFLLHIVVFLKLKLYPARFDESSWVHFSLMLQRFFPFLLGASVVEINLFIDTSIGSYLPKGEVTLLYYAMRYAQIPLGIFSLALSTVLLPYFSRILLYAHGRFHFYLLEVTKLITWVIIPTMLFLMFVSHNVFALIMLKGKASEAHILKAGYLLIILSSGLLVFSLHRSVINILYALKDSWTPTWTTIVATFCNLVGNILGLWYYGVYGIAAATVMSSAVALISCLIVLHKKHGIVFPIFHYLDFLRWFGLQLGTAVTIFLLIFYGLGYWLNQSSFGQFFLYDQGYWLFTGILFFVLMSFLYFTRKRCNIALYFLDFH